MTSIPVTVSLPPFSLPTIRGRQRLNPRRWSFLGQDVFLVLFLVSVLLCLLLFATATRRLHPDERNGLFSSRLLHNEQYVRDARANPCKSQRDAPVIFITSITRPFRDHAEKRGWKQTLWQYANNQQVSKNRPPLWVFTENKWEVEHGREPLSTKDFPFADCVLDVFDVLPKPLNDVSAVDAFYKLAGTPGLNPRIMDGKVLMRKVAAIVHALSAAKEGSIVIWVDVDIVPLRPLDDKFLDFVRTKDVSYLAETVCWRDLNAPDGYASLPVKCLDFRVDTGIVAFKVSTLTRTFAEWWIEAYSSSPGRMLSLARLCLQNATISETEGRELVNFFARERSHARQRVQKASHLCHLSYIRSNLGLNDIYTFAMAVHAFGAEIKHGWLAYKGTRCELNISETELPGGHCHPCVADFYSSNRNATSLISGFNAREYLNHVKGGTAIMARQHTARFEPELGAVRTTDQELLLPREYFPVISHVDHRMACGDKRASYGKTWSLRQLNKTKNR